MRTKADVRLPLQIYWFTPWMPAFADDDRAAAFLLDQAKSLKSPVNPLAVPDRCSVKFAQVQPHTV